jgi:acyl carrier protein
MSANTAVARQLLATALKLPGDAIPETAAIGTLEAWDSLAHVRLMVALEEAVARPLTSDEIVTVTRLSDIVTLLDRPRG